MLPAELPCRGGCDAASGADVVELMHAYGYTRIITWSERTARFAVLLKRLSGQDDLALHAVRLAQTKDAAWKPGVAVDPCQRHLQQWDAHFADDDELRVSLACPTAPLRQEAHKFLVESLVAERVRRLSEMGLLVPSSRVILMYLRFFSVLPKSPAVSEELRNLQRTAWMQKRWSSRFRKSWGLAWGGAPAPHLVRRSTQKTRAAIFYRWLRHVLYERLAGLPAVVVNMDETILSNLRGWKKGVVANGADPEEMAGSELRRDAAISRTSLIASISSVASLQPHLPQIRLPRSKEGEVPSRRAIQAYAEAGAPQIAWHGGHGWNTTQTTVWYIRQLSKTVRRITPGSSLVLVMDCCSVHLSADVLSAAAKLSVHIVIVPARMTWLMQPLDTCVFSDLKRAMRNYEFDAKAASLSGHLAALDRVRVQGDCIRSVLVRRDWSAVMSRAGMAKDGGPLRPSLTRLLEGENLLPRPPSTEELAEILQVPGARARRLLPALLPPSRALPPPAAAAAAPGGGASLAAADATPTIGAPTARVELVRLASLPPRPPAEAPAANVWLPSCLQGRAVTRSMSAALSARVKAPAEVHPGLPHSKRRCR